MCESVFGGVVFLRKAVVSLRGFYEVVYVLLWCAFVHIDTCLHTYCSCVSG